MKINIFYAFLLKINNSLKSFSAKLINKDTTSTLLSDLVILIQNLWSYLSQEIKFESYSIVFIFVRYESKI